MASIVCIHIGCGRYRTRTDDLFRVKEARYQLRQSPEIGRLQSYRETSGASVGLGYVTHAASVGHTQRHPIQSSSTQQCGQCGCGAVVAHHLAKVRVASSNLVIRSSEVLWITWEPTMVAWPRGEATACKAVHTGSNPVATSLTRYHPIEYPHGRLAQR